MIVRVCVFFKLALIAKTFFPIRLCKCRFCGMISSYNYSNNIIVQTTSVYNSSTTTNGYYRHVFNHKTIQCMFLKTDTDAVCVFTLENPF